MTQDITIGDLTMSVAGDELLLRQPSAVSRHIDEIALDVEQQLAVFLYISKKRREANLLEYERSEVGAAMKEFHAHLDVCTRCAGHPFDLCPIGAQLLQEAAAKVLS
jgi:hypothetical protein